MEAKIAEIGIHNPDLDRLPAMRLPADYRVMSETILGVVRSSPQGTVFLTFKDDAEPDSGFDQTWRWGAIPNDAGAIAKTIRALCTLGFTHVAGGGVSWGRTADIRGKREEIERRALQVILGRPRKPRG